MSYHKNLSRWKENTVDIVGRGQEFVAKPKNDKECKKWLMSIFQSVDLKENITSDDCESWAMNLDLDKLFLNSFTELTKKMFHNIKIIF